MIKMLSVLFGTLMMTLLAFSCSPSSSQAQQQGAPPAAAKPSPADPDFQMVAGERAGAVFPRSTLASLRETYGAENVIEQTVYVGEGEEREGLALFPGTPNELEIGLLNGHPEFVRASKTEGQWSAAGIKPGMPLAALEALNGGPFMLFGFEWDYGGTVISWEGGNIPAGVMARLEHSSTGALPSELSGNKEILSHHPMLKEIAPTVQSVTVLFNLSPLQ
ncbi:hypothetical protein [Phaeodactylibacter luteus]|uniref:Uncharacterized protein n=1 Tax=Phaeodactylibacter luteus TaxID=1564516 RepID=A0A5C6RJ26_9BACT|nr:hypothetical protein [Phaeodactylibacter luteus]TXB62426.1 hypothetical protein FRY97_14180 [Phaeodactylibacter luteus]